MLALLLDLLASLRSAFRTHAELALENLALRQQLATLHRSAPPPRLRLADRAFWVGLSQIWSRWADALIIVKPDTVVRWHRAGFRLFGRWKSRCHTPRKDEVSPEVKRLIRRMAKANPLWGAPKIHGELLMLGFVISERSVSRYLPKPPRQPPSQTWRTFLDTHLGSGSIAIACHDMGFDLTGYEIDKDYYDAAVKRLENHQKQGQLFL